jgi:glycosyltransferase involved in cell wall biosynthesis
MRIVYVGAGAAGAYCGACTRDTTLTRAFAALGHEVRFVPLYTPIKSDLPPPGECPVFYSGISVYLEQRSSLFHRTPEFLDRLLDSAWLLEMVEHFAIDTRAEDLGEMTVSVLRGESGRQRKELKRLVRFLRRSPRPDVINITNSLLSVIAPAVKEALGVPVVCNLQGEDDFVEHLGQPWREEAQRLLRAHASAVDAFVSPGEAYADEMAEYLACDRSRFRVIRPGVDAAAFEGAPGQSPGVFRIGYLSRITPVKGIDLLCEAFLMLERELPGKCRLAVAGEVRASQREFWTSERERITAAGFGERFEYVPAPDLAGKVAFLRRCDVFSVPSRMVERQAMASLEAMAAGCPVVLPDAGVCREIIALCGGGLLAEPNNAGSLAAALAQLRDDPQLTRRLGQEAAAGVRRHFSSDTMAANTLRLYAELGGK